MRKILGAAVAVLLFSVAPAAANAATLTVTKKTTNADATASFAFHVEFTPFPFDNPGPFKFPPQDFTLKHGTSKTFTDVHKGFYTVTEKEPAGWKLQSIECTKDPDPADAPVISGTSVKVELSAAENKECVFTNAPVQVQQPPTTPQSPPSTPPTQTPPPVAGTAPVTTAPPAPAAKPPTPQSQVSPERVVSAQAALQAPRACVSRRYTLTVTGGPVRSVTFTINGRKVRTLNARANQRRFTLTLGVRSAVDRVVARVRFRSNASPQVRTLRATIRRCAQAGVSPEFTG